ncbi:MULTISPECIES: hypothetical protein [unclassified Microcoleus]|uniref:hypothetical protein n=1 Tax=unclassified Microcoleus TaxID=2642155 RepID=UPI001D2032C9|nr:MULTISPECIES: hypothetical protein [unclassified Microcoleus]MCC3474447.1 hypothetical protein [Microcoleus sp. PH2017_13_LAR_U_A]MCC3486914.1 hypothetical protein [Microcoleus sp. PH2017_14_LAR_D_A]MCC3565359.1 hypothetical protein [Microcoleus sp. PH2017_31_RDM_U_A]MCC3577686.1 hypothetical protein [Microcoleus sp. PH2017_32_RDM_D_A]MCC3600003.1 hypothetical protein [Microcoleus sp. PH2017_26_ELK_O_A]
MESSTRAGGFCLCSRGFNRRVFWVSTVGFFVDVRSHFWLMGFTDSDKETGFLAEFVACDRVLSKKPGFWGLAIGFCVDGRSGFVWMGDRVLCGWANLLSLKSRRLETASTQTMSASAD